MEHSPSKTDEGDRLSNDVQSIAPLDHAPQSVLDDGALDPVYAAKARVLNKAIQEIGMGRYQVANVYPFRYLTCAYE